jgi:hypothetical protein
MQYLNEQPDSISADDIIDFIMLQERIRAGQQALGNGNYYSHEEAKRILLNNN